MYRIDSYENEEGKEYWKVSFDDRPYFANFPTLEDALEYVGDLVDEDLEDEYNEDDNYEEEEDYYE